tara:strand:+ start:2528 stop:2764 length:237 start_codon:yes stop_codon:yes gene_type:complete
MTKIKIIHRREECIGCNSCVEHAPEDWDISDIDGKSSLKESKETKKGTFIKEISELEFEKNKLAEHDCPSRIIRVVKE